jgi:hypothetical protein
MNTVFEEEKKEYFSPFSNEKQILLIKTLFQYFPVFSEEIFKQLETNFLSNSQYQDENKKAEILISQLFKSKILNESLIQLLENLASLNDFDFARILESFIHEGRETEDILLSQNMTLEKLQILFDNVTENIEKFEKLDNQLSNYLFELLKILNIAKFLNVPNEIILVKKNLEKKIQDITNLQQKLFDLYQKNLENLQKIENQLSLLNEENLKSSIINNLDIVISSFQEYIIEINNLNNQLESFTELKPDDVLRYVNLLSQISSFLPKYYELKNYIFTLKINEINNDILNDLESSIYAEYQNFIKKSIEVFKKNVENASDKKVAVKARFLEPIKNKVESKDFNLLLQFFRTFF